MASQHDAARLTAIKDGEIVECARMLAKLWAKERDYPFWGNEMVTSDERVGHQGDL